jgi:hypothetical protein
MSAVEVGARARSSFSWYPRFFLEFRCVESLVSWFLAGSDEESEIADLFDFLLSHGPAGMFSSTSEFSFVSWPAIRFLD